MPKVLVMDFDSKDAISARFGSEEYRAPIPAREKGFASMTSTVPTGCRLRAPHERVAADARPRSGTDQVVGVLARRGRVRRRAR